MRRTIGGPWRSPLRFVSKVYTLSNNTEGLPVEVKRPEGYYCQHLYLPKLHRRPTEYVIYHSWSSSLLCTPRSNLLMLDPVDKALGSLCVMKGVMLSVLVQVGG